MIEDDALIQLTTATRLQRAGYKVATASNGREALKYLRENEPPSCIVLDLMMPVMDGWEFRERQLANPALASIPVLITTALSEEGRNTPELQGLPVVPKPFQLDQIVGVVDSLCASGSLADTTPRT